MRRPESGSAAQARVDAATGFLAQNTSEEVGALRQRGGGEVDVRPQPSNPMCGSPPNKPCPGHPSLVTHAVPETSDQVSGDHMPEQVWSCLCRVCGSVARTCTGRFCERHD